MSQILGNMSPLGENTGCGWKSCENVVPAGPPTHGTVNEQRRQRGSSGGALSESEFIKGRLCFSTFEDDHLPQSTPQVVYFSTDTELVYEGFHGDFGPLNLGHLHRYCTKLQQLLGTDVKRVVHYTHCHPERRANAAFLIASFAVLHLHMTPERANQTITLAPRAIPLRPFQDASWGGARPARLLPLLDCLRGLHRARQLGLLDMNDFDEGEFARCRGLLGGGGSGGVSWLVPGKLLAFPGPLPASTASNTGPRPEQYAKYFKQNGVVAVVRLNRKTYDARRFTASGIKHFDLFLSDGSSPSRSLLSAFLHIVENLHGAVAVHCKAGLGRTGSLIGAYIVKHFRMSAMEAIAWMRICRPGCVIGQQQDWLRHSEAALWRLGDTHRLRLYGDPHLIAVPIYGVYSVRGMRERALAKKGRDHELAERKSRRGRCRK